MENVSATPDDRQRSYEREAAELYDRALLAEQEIQRLRAQLADVARILKSDQSDRDARWEALAVIERP